MPQEHKFFLEGSEVGVKPTLTGDEPDPLKLSIQKWQFIVDCLEVGLPAYDDGGVLTCALCRAYGGPECTECPIYKLTGHSHCICTPMQMWEMELRTFNVAKAELYFLVALREYAEHMEWEESET